MNHSCSIRQYVFVLRAAAISVLALSPSALRAETVTDLMLGFTLNLSDDLSPRPDLVGTIPDIVHAFELGQAAEGEVSVLLLIERMSGVIGRERVDAANLPAEFNGKLFDTTWQGFEVQGFEVPESVNGIDVVTYNVQIPLAPKAIQVRLFGRADQMEMLRAELRKVLDGLHGESNWLSSAAPTTLADSENYRTILLSAAIGGIMTGLFLL
jgi:hypothetical protein